MPWEAGVLSKGDQQGEVGTKTVRYHSVSLGKSRHRTGLVRHKISSAARGAERRVFSATSIIALLKQ